LNDLADALGINLFPIPGINARTRPNFLKKRLVLGVPILARLGREGAQCANFEWKHGHDVPGGRPIRLI